MLIHYECPKCGYKGVTVMPPDGIVKCRCGAPVPAARKPGPAAGGRTTPGKAASAGTTAAGKTATAPRPAAAVPLKPDAKAAPAPDTGSEREPEAEVPVASPAKPVSKATGRSAAPAPAREPAKPSARGLRRDPGRAAMPVRSDGDRPKKKPPVPWLIAAGLGAAVLLVGVGVLVTSGGRKPTPAKRPASSSPGEAASPGATASVKPEAPLPEVRMGGATDAELKAFDRKLAQTLAQLKTLEDIGAKVALAEDLARSAPDAQARHEATKVLNTLEDAADAENDRRYKAAQAKASALVAEKKLAEAADAWDAFQAVFDRRGAWKAKADGERDALRARAGWDGMRKRIDDAVAQGRFDEAESLIGQIPAQAAGEATSLVLEWQKKIDASRSQGAALKLTEARRKRFEAARADAERRVDAARESATKEAKENAERDQRLAEALSALTTAAPLRIPFTKDFVLDKVRIAGFSVDRVKLAWPQGEMDYPVDKLPATALGIFEQALKKGSAIDHLHVGKLYLHCRQLDRAEACFTKAAQMDAAVRPLCPDMKRLRRATQPFRGDYRTVGNHLTVTWDFESAEEVQDFTADARTKIETARGAGLRISGEAPSPVCRVNEIPFLDRFRFWAVPGASDANHLVGVRIIRPDGSDVLVYVVLKASARRFLVNKLEDRKTTPLVPEKPYEGDGTVKFDFEDGRLAVGVGAEAWSGTESGFTNVLLILGVAGDPKGAKQADFKQVTVSGVVNPQWIVKQVAVFQDVLVTELGREHRVVGDDGERGLPPLSLDVELDAMGTGVREAYRAAVASVDAFFKKPEAESLKKAWEGLDALGRGHPSFAQPLYWQARLAERIHSRARAEAYGKDALRRCPDFPEAQALVSRLQAEAGAWAEAREADARALALQPDLAEARLVRARILLHDGKPADALGETALAEKLAPLDADLRRRSRMLRNVIRGPGWSRERKVETAHFRVRSDLPQDRLKAYAEELEAIRAHYAAVTGLASEAGAERVDVLLFNTAEGYFGYVEFASGDRLEHTSGCFISWYGQLIFFENANPVETRAVMYHEGLHRFLFDTLPDAPIWFQEGMAEYVAGTRLEGGKVAEAALVRAGRLQNLKMAMRHGWRPLAFKIVMNETRGQFYALFPPLQYAQAWSMIHFFRHGEDGKYAGVLDAYIRRMAAGDDAAKAFDATFGKENLDEMQKQWLKYVDALKA